MFLTPDEFGSLQSDLGQSLVRFLPELILCTGIVLVLFLRLFNGLNRLHMGSIALVVTVLALAVSVEQWRGRDVEENLFSWMLVSDRFTIYLRLFLYSFTALIIWLSVLTGIPDREDSADFYCLLLGATVGMALMASANHLLMVYIGVEMASLPSYALAGFLKGRRQSSEAALKYVVYGGGASGIMLYGISLLAGRFGTGYLPDLGACYLEALRTAPASSLFGGTDSLLLLGTLFVLIGIGFKLAAVPFHFWCPDVFEGASAEVAGFLSVASKGAALALLVRVIMAFTGLSPIDREHLPPPSYEAWINATRYLAPSLAIFAALTATFGNFAAYLQTNLKRLLAYSTIAHAGYMMMGLATLTPAGVSAMLFYLVAYLFMNLGAFAVVAFLRNQTGSEDLSAYRGLVQRAPVLVITLAVFLLSLLGMPPLAGFAAKFQVFSALYRAGDYYGGLNQVGLSWTMYALLVIGGLNTVVSLVYYAKVLKVMVLDKPLEEVEGRPPARLAVPWGAALYSSLLAVAVLLGGIFWSPMAAASDARTGAARFRQPPPQKAPTFNIQGPAVRGQPQR
jgi:NADH-quinone oxidoreductase subunit N